MKLYTCESKDSRPKLIKNCKGIGKILWQNMY